MVHLSGLFTNYLGLLLVILDNPFRKHYYEINKFRKRDVSEKVINKK